MTANQIAYQANLERERSNRINESIASRQADASAMQARSSATQAAASMSKARVSELEYQLKHAKNSAEIAKIKAEIDRLNHQNFTDSVNAVTGGMANIRKAFTGILG